MADRVALSGIPSGGLPARPIRMGIRTPSVISPASTRTGNPARVSSRSSGAPLYIRRLWAFCLMIGCAQKV